MKMMIRVLLVVLVLMFSCIGCSKGKPVADSSITDPAFKMYGWDRLYPVKISPAIYNLYKKLLQTNIHPALRQSKLSFEDSVELFTHLCSIYEIKYPNKIVLDPKYLEQQDKKFKLDSSSIIIGQTRMINVNGKKTAIIYFRSTEVPLETIFHEFNHFLDHRKNGEFLTSVDENKNCDYSGNQFWSKYLSKLYIYHNLQNASNQF